MGRKRKPGRPKGSGTKRKRRLSVKIRDGRKRIQIGGKKYTLTAVGKGTKKGSRKRRLPPRVKTGKRKGQFRKRKK